MKSNNILKLIMKNDLVIPNILLINYKELKINEKELIFLSYLMSFENIIPFDINSFKDQLNYTTEEIMNIMSSLTEKKLIDMKIKLDNNKSKEYIDLSYLYNKLLSYTLKEETDIEEDNSKIYQEIEKEFGRFLSPIEYETIKHWLDSKIDENLIKEALKEAVLNGVNNLKYIDKILAEWTKKGYRKPQDIKNKKTNNNEKIDLFDYDWLDNE